MRERPILFSAPMVRAILRGTKTQTRRPVKTRALHVAEPHPHHSPYGAPGDVLWVRETWAVPEGSTSQADVAYRADVPPDAESDERWARRTSTQKAVWSPSIHMPRWAARIFLEVTGVRVERLQSISEGDAVAEGLLVVRTEPEVRYAGQSKNPGEWRSPVRAFESLWDSINGGKYPWDSDPLVWVVSFVMRKG